MSDLLNQASLVFIPSGYKEDTAYTVIPTDGSGDLTFTRASNGTRVNSAGLVEVCPWNLVSYSEDFTNAAYNKLRVSITSNAIAAPNGTTTADKIESTSTGAAVELYQVFTLLGNQSYCASVYLKKGSGNTDLNQFDVYNGSGSYAARVSINFATGVITQSIGSGASVESVGDGWYKIIVPFTGYAGNNFFYIGSSGDYFPSGQYVYGWGLQVNIGSTAKPYFPTTDRLNVPRLTYQNGGGGCPSLLLEKQSTNIAYPSQAFSGFSKSSDVTLTDNNAISPDGTQNATYYFCNTTTTNGYLIPNFSGTSGVQYAVSFYAKAKELSLIYIKNVNDSGGQSSFDLSNGTYTLASGIDSLSIVSVGNGWYRCIAISTSSSTSINFVPIIKGNANQGIHIWGLQIEQSSYPTSYIPTTSSSATRVADACSKTGISSLIDSTEGVVFCDFVCNGFANLGTIFSLNDGTTANYIWLNTFSNGDLRAELYLAGSGPQTQLYYAPAVIGQRYKFAFSYKQNDFALYVNGSQIATDNSGNTFSAGTLIRADFDLTSPSSYALSPIQVNQAILFPTRLTNAELASLTTL